MFFFKTFQDHLLGDGKSNTGSTGIGSGSLLLDEVPKDVSLWLRLPKALLCWIDAVELSILANASQGSPTGGIILHKGDHARAMKGSRLQ
jgi:hypothetical protein